MGIIYKIINLVNGKFYIGSTIRPLRIRKYEHLSSLRKNKHPNDYLQKSFNKYGEKNFKFEILEKLNFEKCLSKKEIAKILVNREMELIEIFSPDYNLKISNTIGKSGYKHSEETRKKISEANLKRYEGKELSKRTIYKRSLKERKNDPNGFKPLVQKNKLKMNKKIKNINNLFDVKLQKRENQKKAAESRIGKHHSTESKIKMINTKYKIERLIEMYDMNDNLLKVFNFQPEASKISGVSRSSISNNLIGLSKSAGGYVFKYKIII